MTISIITGPTASGKSKLALDMGLPIINADSLQLYRGLPLLTACPSATEMNQTAHLLYEILAPTSQCTVTQWMDMVVAEINKHDNKVVIVGGSGFYIKALTEGLSPIPDIDPAVRETLMQRLEHVGLQALYAELQSYDPELAERLMPSDTQRICRGLEVYQGTGETLSSWQKRPRVKLPYDFTVKLVMPEREILYQRCDARFLKMIDEGVLDEVERFITTSHDQHTQLSKALGFKELRAYLHGDMDLDTAITLAQTATRQFAKRQVTWFRHQLGEHTEVC